LLFILFAIKICEIPYGSFSNYDQWTSQYPPKAGYPTFPKPTDNILQLPQSIKKAFQEIEATVQDIQRSLNTVGVSAAILYNQSIIWSKGFGFADRAKGTKVSLDTIFRIGSVSKVFTAVELMILRDKGLLNVDDEVVKYFPDFYLRNPWGSISTKGITFRQLATHLAGLPRETPCDDFFSKESATHFRKTLTSKTREKRKDLPCNISNREMFKRLHNLQYISPPDMLPVYSNLGFSLLGNMLASIANSSFNDLIMSDIIQPLKLKNTGVIIQNANPSLLATPYNQDLSECTVSNCLNDFGWSNPAGSFYSSARDLASLMSLFFRDYNKYDKYNGQILDGSSIRDMFRPQWINTDLNSGFCMPFEIVKFHDYLLKTKRGDVNGYAIEIIMVPEFKLGILVMTNIVEHAPYYAKPIAKIIIPKIHAAFTFLEEKVVPPPNIQKYVGNYYYQEFGNYNISVSISNAETLLIYSNDVELDNILTWTTNNTFIMSPPFGDMNVCWDVQSGNYFQTVYFQSNGNGDIISLTLDITAGWIFIRK